MKVYQCKLAQLSGHVFWAFCLYAIIAVVIDILFHLMTHAEDYTHTTFAIIFALWLGQIIRFRKMKYKINDDTLVQYDFQSRTIFIDQIVSVHVLDRMKWVSLHTPYNIVIKTTDNQKYFMAPQNVDLLAEILKKENPDIQFTQG